jgi:hypothetical protein
MIMQSGEKDTDSGVRDDLEQVRYCMRRVTMMISFGGHGRESVASIRITCRRSHKCPVCTIAKERIADGAVQLREEGGVFDGFGSAEGFLR